MLLSEPQVPNSGDGLKRLEYRTGEAGWDLHFSDYLKGLSKKKPVVVTGDLNCAHKEIDIHAPKRNLRSAGFTQVPAALLVVSCAMFPPPFAGSSCHTQCPESQ